MKSKLILFLSFLILVSACSMAPKYKQPDMPIAQNWPDVNTADQVQNSTVVKWQEFFQSESLQEVIRITLENNKNLKIAALNIEAAQALYRIKKSGVLPTLDGTGSGSRRHITKKSSASGNDFISSQYDANLNTSFELDLFGRVKSLKDAALEDFLAIEETRNALQVSLIAETTNAYMQWLADSKILSLTSETLKVQEQSYEIISKNHEAGIASKLDLLQSKTTVETAKVNLSFYARRVAQDKNALVLLMGVDKLEDPLLKQTIDDIKLDQTLPVGLPATILLNRPDVKAAEHQLKSMNANIGAARAAFFPKISLTAAYGFSSASLSTLFSGGAIGAWSFVPKITAPIFDGGNNRAGLQYAKVKKDMAINQYEKVIQTAFREVADELAARKNLWDQFNAQINLAQTAKETYELASARYQNGVIRYMVVLDSQKTLYGAQQNLIEIEKLRLANLINLYKVLGGGWEREPSLIQKIEESNRYPNR